MKRDRRAPDQALTFQPGKPSVRVAFGSGNRRFKARNRPAPIQDQHGIAVPYLVDQRAEPVLGFGYTSFLHMARIA